MMIAARLAGGNLFLPFLGGGFFWWGILGALGALGAARSTRIFFEGICGGGILFFGGWWGVFWIVSVGKN
ncbi:MAG: hypothetical protein SPG73_11000 [Sodaliphilus sp.]|nr:hypothetical protein [Sodaliphilus sp.]